jgi:hypothetical protein
MTAQFLPENGIKSDFKQAVLRTIPPRPFYHRRSVLRSLNLKYCLLVNSMIGFNNLVKFAVDVYCQEATLTNSLANLGVTALEIWVIMWTYRSTVKAENSIERNFYKLAENLIHFELCPRNSPDTFLNIANTERMMANVIRRRDRRVRTYLMVWLYNLLHRKTRKCSTCLQIQHAYLNDRSEYLANKKRYKLENCPFCGWDY